MLLIIDNYDSFTYNLYQYFLELNIEVLVRKNDSIDIDEIRLMSPSHIVISPGPCSPEKTGISKKVIQNFSGKIPILGVCIGHQAIGQVFGASVVKAKKPIHGKSSKIYHQGIGILKGVSRPFVAARYHSLVIEISSLPNILEITSWTIDKNGNIEEIMGIRHKRFLVEGVQYHPESILTEDGHKILKNFINY
ncbi:anthranilate synthase component II [Candidatus Riesia pediculicola]|nr:aminodeoxychorismate/anthranilate synthase component II [Candidatus Riesia pediculicola]ARC53605.1 anthranilate synthase [Candidatus Riesia pediculicola]QOJ86652.1 aminodeoxychorismate/anthranilate synthase component II [Candidatus Riesia pediculicola]